MSKKETACVDRLYQYVLRTQAPVSYLSNKRGLIVAQLEQTMEWDSY
jgi:hypothetical protein